MQTPTFLLVMPRISALFLQQRTWLSMSSTRPWSTSSLHDVFVVNELLQSIAGFLHDEGSALLLTGLSWSIVSQCLEYRFEIRNYIHLLSEYWHEIREEEQFMYEVRLLDIYVRAQEEADEDDIYYVQNQMIEDGWGGDSD